jgi:guanylate kinase
MDIDVKGAARIRAKTTDCVTIFIIPPTFKELAKRLAKRRTETREAIKKRLSLARKELKDRVKYDYILINKDLNKAVNLIESVLELENSRRYNI